MTLRELLNADVDLADYALVAGEDIRDAVISAQPADAQFQVRPMPLPDGRWFLCADILSERQGLFAQAFHNLPRGLGTGIEVMPMAEVLALLGDS